MAVCICCAREQIKDTIHVYHVQRGLQFKGRLQTPIRTSRDVLGASETAGRSRGSTQSLRHLAALYKQDVRMLMDTMSKIVVTEIAENTQELEAGQTLSWTDFLEKFPVPSEGGAGWEGISHVRHAVAGQRVPWDLSDSQPSRRGSASDAASGDVAGAIVQAASASSAAAGSGTGTHAGIHMPGGDASESLVSIWLQQISEAARSGNLQVVDNRLEKIKEVLVLQKAKQSRVSFRTGSRVGGSCFRPEFLLHAVRFAEHLKLGVVSTGLDYDCAIT